MQGYILGLKCREMSVLSMLVFTRAGVNGVFMGDGRTKQSLMATGGCRRILTEATVRSSGVLNVVGH